jgi:hypothetical protein
VRVSYPIWCGYDDMLFFKYLGYKEKDIWDVIYKTQNIIYHKTSIDAVVLFSQNKHWCAKDGVRVPPSLYFEFSDYFADVSPDQILVESLLQRDETLWKGTDETSSKHTKKELKSIEIRWNSP